jgi:hypothetical protein
MTPVGPPYLASKYMPLHGHVRMVLTLFTCSPSYASSLNPPECGFSSSPSLS